MRLLWLYGIVDRLFERMYVCTIPLYGCMDRRSRYTWEIPGDSYQEFILVPLGGAVFTWFILAFLEKHQSYIALVPLVLVVE